MRPRVSLRVLLSLVLGSWGAEAVQVGSRCGVGVACRARPLRLSTSEQPVWEGQPTAETDTSAAAGVPIPFRPLDRQEVVDRLDAVPVFSVVNSDQMMLPSRPANDSALSCTFYLDLADARLALASASELNPGMALSLAVTPLGTAFALSEWQQPPPALDDDDADTAARQGVAQILRETISGSPPPAPSAAASTSASTSASAEIRLRLQANQAEIDAVRHLLAASPTPPLLARRNKLEGAIPLFGSDEIRFAPRKEEGRGAEEGAEEGAEDGAAVEEDYLLPLFLRREDLLSAWVASGGAAETPPPIQATDLRTLAWQMECDSDRNWRPILLVAPDESIAIVEQMQQKPTAAAPTPSLSKADALGLIFGSSEV